MKANLQKIVSEHRRELILGLFCVAFFFLYSWFYVSTPEIYNSPDETANAVFIEQFIADGSFQLPSGSLQEQGVIPRSVSILQGALVPTGFLGLPLLYGVFGMIFGDTAPLLLTPMFAVISVFAFRGILRRIFSEDIAFLSALGMLFLPQWWHFAGKGFLPNVAFVSLLLISLYILIRASELERFRRYLMAAGGAASALALMIRPAEIWWVALILVLLLFTQRRISRTEWILFAGMGAGAIFVCWLPFQLATYGGIFQSGYGVRPSVSEAGQGGALSIFFPFGVNLWHAVTNGFNFGFRLFWWQVIPVSAGFLFWLKAAEKNVRQNVYATIFVVVGLYLLLLYGSWNIQDDLDADRVSIGVSYVRYWLPVFIGMLPFLFLGMRRIAQKARIPYVMPILLALLLGGQTVYVYGAGDDNLGALRENVVNYNQVREKTLEQTTENAVIVSERMDKVFWPDRSVLHYEDDIADVITKLQKLERDAPVYWFTLLPNDHVFRLEQTEFLPNGFELRQQFTADQGTLYHVIPVSEL